MTKKGIIQCILSILLVAYLAVVMTFAYKECAVEPYKDLQVNVLDKTGVYFVTKEDIYHELGTLDSDIKKTPSKDVNTRAIEQKILAMDNIEDANCLVLNNRVVRLDVTPLVPVARIFDTFDGTNYYINHSGKKMMACSRYRIDVPVVVGWFGNKCKPTDVLPVVDFVNQNENLTHLVSAIKVARNGDIILIPRVKGHVVNFGDSTDISNKFDRLLTFYHNVMPVKGWEYYDTISVKWRSQIVAKKHNPQPLKEEILLDPEEYIDDPGTMMGAENDEDTAA